jgi:hypothetical protein
MADSPVVAAIDPTIRKKPATPRLIDSFRTRCDAVLNRSRVIRRNLVLYKALRTTRRGD